jgi:MAE_28990/MAE_18760-like HEPN
MKMEDLKSGFEERLKEIETYLDFLDALEYKVQQGIPRFGETGSTVTPQQQKILYSSVYLQLYNLVESTINTLLDTISELLINSKLRPSDLSSEFRKAWIRCFTNTHKDLSYDKRLEASLALHDHIMQGLPISESVFSRGGGANWDDQNIYELSTKLGLPLNISKEANKAAKKPVKDGMGTLVLIREYRNKLSHGDLSFVECGENTTVNDLREIKDAVTLYMREVISEFTLSIDSQMFLVPERRKAGSIVQ